MKAIVMETIIEYPASVAGRSTACLSSIKSVAQIIYTIQGTGSMPETCLPSMELDWIDALDFVIEYLEERSRDTLSERPYGVWIMQALREKYPCE